MSPTPAPSRFFARLAIAGAGLAVLALGGLAVWAAIVTQNGARGLSAAGVQVSGHLRASQALSRIDTQTDALEDRVFPSGLRQLRRSQIVLDDALERMERGEVEAERMIAGRAGPLVAMLNPLIERFVTEPAGKHGSGPQGTEVRMDEAIGELQILLNDLDADPSRLLTEKLASVSETEDTVRTTAFVFIPLGLGGVAACAWLLGSYRRRSEGVMLAAIEHTAHEARTDALTGLPNRRALLEEFDRCSDGAVAFELMLADLNGFKRFNDTFGHQAGDELLSRLGEKLTAAFGARGFAARLGGDEFCILMPADVPKTETAALLEEALSEDGEGFRITASSGAASVPEEARDPSAALALADARMYAVKNGARAAIDPGMSAVLTRMLDARHPGLGSHVEDVAILARSCAERLGLSAEEVLSVQRAAELHDLGKIAIPSTILAKPGQLTDDERREMQRHSVIGAQILGGTEARDRVAAIVHSSHERWDGGGYPDGLAGEAIPLGARIVFVADSFCAMTEDRPYAEARSVPASRDELRACAGTQFDPAVVSAFLETLDTIGFEPMAPVAA